MPCAYLEHTYAKTQLFIFIWNSSLTASCLLPDVATHPPSCCTWAMPCWRAFAVRPELGVLGPLSFYLHILTCLSQTSAHTMPFCKTPGFSLHTPLPMSGPFPAPFPWLNYPFLCVCLFSTLLFLQSQVPGPFSSPHAMLPSLIPSLCPFIGWCPPLS